MKAVKGHTVCHEFQVKDTATLDFCSEEFGQTTYITPTSLLKKLIQRRSTLNIWWTLTYQFLLVCDIQFLAIIVLLLHLLFQSIFTYNQYSCLENPHGQRSLAGYSPWGHKELDTTERLSRHIFFAPLGFDHFRLLAWVLQWWPQKVLVITSAIHTQLMA